MDVYLSKAEDQDYAPNETRPLRLSKNCGRNGHVASTLPSLRPKDRKAETE
jgi:hypothetical protein